jgi:hypothetical protein
MVLQEWLCFKNQRLTIVTLEQFVLIKRKKQIRKYILFLYEFKYNCLRKSPIKKIDFLKSTSHVDFLKAHIKLSYLANFQNFWTSLI